MGFTVAVCFVAIAMVGTENPNLKPKGLGLGPKPKPPNSRFGFWSRDHGSGQKNAICMTHDHPMTWPPLTWMFFGPRASFNILHVHCFLKKPWCWIKAKVELSSFFWKHWSRGVVKLTYLHQFKSDSKLQSWLMRVDKFLIDHSRRSGSKPVRWRRKKNFKPGQNGWGRTHVLIRLKIFFVFILQVSILTFVNDR